MPTILDSKKKSYLINSWNNVFKSSVFISDNSSINDTDTLFNNFLSEYQKDQKYEYNENICVCLKNGNKLNLYSSNDNKIEFREIGLNTRKKFKNYINNYDIVITNFNIENDFVQNCLKINPNKVFLRYEILHSSFSGGKSNFITDQIAFPNENPAAYLTKAFYKKLIKNSAQLSFFKYSSFLLNHFESGKIIGDVSMKPKINVSDFGRWYWSGSCKIQQDREYRDNLINNIQNIGGKYISIDFISASPSMLAKITKSKTLNNMVKSRIKNTDNKEYTNIIKQLLNI
jgi:hypothetical protein